MGAGEDGELCISRLIVHPQFFRRGIGYALVQHIINSGGKAVKYTVSTGAANDPAKSLYKKLGFVEIQDVEVEPNVILTFLEKLGQ